MPPEEPQRFAWPLILDATPDYETVLGRSEIAGAGCGGAQGAPKGSRQDVVVCTLVYILVYINRPLGGCASPLSGLRCISCNALYGASALSRPVRRARSRKTARDDYRRKMACANEVVAY